MNNPYSPPEADVRLQTAVPASPTRLHPLKTAAIWLIFLLSVLQFWGMVLFMLQQRELLIESVRTGAMPLSMIVLVIVQPGAFFLGGVLLLFRRRIAALGFAIWLLCSFGSILIEGKPPMVLSILFNLGALALTLHLRKQGHLR